MAFLVSANFRLTCEQRDVGIGGDFEVMMMVVVLGVWIGEGNVLVLHSGDEGGDMIVRIRDENV